MVHVEWRVTNLEDLDRNMLWNLTNRAVGISTIISKMSKMNIRNIQDTVFHSQPHTRVSQSILVNDLCDHGLISNQTDTELTKTKDYQYTIERHQK